MKEDLEKQVQAQRKAKAEEKLKEVEYMEQMKQMTEDKERQDRQKQDQMKRKLQQEKQIRDLQLQEISMKKTEEQKIEKIEDDARRYKIELEAKEQASKDKQKVSQYKSLCKQQYLETLEFKETTKKKLEEGLTQDNINNDMLGSLF